MIKILSRLKLTAESWFDALNEEQKKVYLEEHPDSKYAKNFKGGRRGYYVPNFRSDLDLRYHYDSIPSRETMEETRNFVDKELGRNSTNLL